MMVCSFGPLYSTAPASYRFIPIIPLLREVTDWTMTQTCLRLKHYLTVQEIWAQLFLLSMYRRWERVSVRCECECEVGEGECEVGEGECEV